MMTSNIPYKLIILISGNGSNLQAIIDAIQDKKINAQIAAVISNQAEAFGLERAKKAHIPTHVLPNKNFNDRKDYDTALEKIIDAYDPQLIVLAGFMRILTPEFVAHYAGRMINIHPSLLPDYRGLNTHERVIEAQEKLHGVSVHFVTEELDGGPIIAQMSLPIHEQDTPESLQQRVHILEHKLYPQVIEWLATNKVMIKEGQIKWLDNELDKLAQNGPIKM